MRHVTASRLLDDGRRDVGRLATGVCIEQLRYCGCVQWSVLIDYDRPYWPGPRIVHQQS